MGKCANEPEKDGWRLTSTTSGQHLQRTLEMCAELGFEVRTEEVDPAECEECTVCYTESGEKMYRVYTRSRETAGDDLRA